MAKVMVVDEPVLFQKYQPKRGKIYEAVYVPRRVKDKRKTWCSGSHEFCIITILDKKIILRPGEFELLEA